MNLTSADLGHPEVEYEIFGISENPKRYQRAAVHTDCFAPQIAILHESNDQNEAVELLRSEAMAGAIFLSSQSIVVVDFSTGEVLESAQISMTAFVRDW